ncbi:MAG TPA: alpha/beta hydrolase [Nitratifractor sp.]|nr:alpha/beta hydrolase [Nitratifractor sp.]
MAICDVSYRGDLFSLSYMQDNIKQPKSILFLHGWGSNKEIMHTNFKNYLSDFRIISVDMPGFGASKNEESILTTKDYKNIIEIFLQTIGVEPNVIAGHSFGGKVATLLQPKCLVLLSSAGILVPKPFSVKFKIALFKLLKPFGVQKIRRLFVADDAKKMNHAMYETFKNVVDEEFEDNFKNYQGKALLFWGKSDTATPLWTAEKIANLIADSKLYPLDGDHFFFTKHAQFISNTISQECKDYNG